MKTENNLDFKRIQEAIVLFAVVCLSISYFGGYYLIITTIGHHSTLLRECAVVLLFLKVLTTKYNKKEFIVVVTLLMLAFANYKASGNTRALYNFLMLCALKDVELKKVFKIALISVSFIVILMGILALTGVTGVVSVTEDFGRGTWDSQVETRYYMGYIHPNTWAQAMFAIMTLIVASFYEEMNWKGILVIFAINYGVYLLAVSRTCFISGLALVILLIWSKYGQKIFESKLIRAGIVAGVTMLWAIIFTVKWDIGNNIYLQLFDWKFFTGRIRQAQAYYQAFGLTPFGMDVPDKLGNGYILDMGYMRMLLENGIIIFALMYVATIVLLIAGFVKKRNDIVILTICICLYGIYENQAIAQVPANLAIYYMAIVLFTKNSESFIKKRETRDNVSLLGKIKDEDIGI